MKGPAEMPDLFIANRTQACYAPEGMNAKRRVSNPAGGNNDKQGTV